MSADDWRDLQREYLPGYDPYATRADGDYFDVTTANSAVNFFHGGLVFIEGKTAGEPFILQPWQMAGVGATFGWKRPDPTGEGESVRRYREAFWYVARKNGKSPTIAGLVLLVMFTDHEPGAQLYSAAAEREQAALVYRHAAGMVSRNSTLANKVRCYRTMKSIEFGSESAIFKSLSSDADTKHGLNVHFLAVDELHALPSTELVDVLTTGTGSRRQPLIVYITTADYLRESVCNKKYDYACKVRDGVIDDPSFLPIVYECLVDDDWTDPKVWKKANPNLGVSVNLEYLRRECEKAKNDPSYENTFKRLHLNIRTQQDVRWIPLELWDGCGSAFDLSILEGRECWAGLDFGWRDDLAALVYVFEIEDEFYWLPRFWIPREAARDIRRPPIGPFIDEGLITVTQGNSTDIDTIYTQLREDRKRYTIRGVSLDPANARKQGQDLMNDGFDVYEFIQSKRTYNEPCRFLISLLKEGKLHHGGHKVLRWMAANVAAEMNGLNQIMPSKKVSSEKIDGICAGVMGLDGLMRVPDSAVPEVFVL